MEHASSKASGGPESHVQETFLDDNENSFHDVVYDAGDSKAFDAHGGAFSDVDVEE